ncbi:hypothetical protein KTN04_10580 [Marinobacterium sp. A346]|uniref:Transposase n=1 Tax=Marinobacterium weihaiense TaxID=2851016 RepID=A0ABS6MBX6_9GAMM|nr:hypothetical protein [Marinobacterium weihaiense]
MQTLFAELPKKWPIQVSVDAQAAIRTAVDTQGKEAGTVKWTQASHDFVDILV